MRHAMIMAGGSGTRLWPLSRKSLPKQLMPVVKGKSLLEKSAERLDGLTPKENLYVCAGQAHQKAVLGLLPDLKKEQFIGEPIGRDTLNALALSMALISRRDPRAVVAVFTADHLIEPVADFQKVVRAGFDLVEENPDTLVTFGIAPTEAATGYGYLELGPAINDSACLVKRFKEKPAKEKAADYYKAGPSAFLWNSGMFLWRAATFMECVARYEPENHGIIQKIVQTAGTDAFAATLDRLFPTLKKISVDFAVMEPASQDSDFKVAALPMRLIWKDIGSWEAFADIYASDSDGNALTETAKVLHQSRNTFLHSSDPSHTLVAVGLHDLIVVHTDDATLICKKGHDQEIKAVLEKIAARGSGKLL